MSKQTIVSGVKVSSVNQNIDVKLLYWWSCYIGEVVILV